MWGSGSGAARSRRHTALAEMVTAATRAGNFEAPWRSTPRLWEFFDDEGDVLRELQNQWRAALAGAVYVAIDSGHGDLQHDVMAAYCDVRRRHHGIHEVLEAHAGHPAIAAARHKERALLASFHQLVDEAAVAA